MPSVRVRNRGYSVHVDDPSTIPLVGGSNGAASTRPPRRPNALNTRPSLPTLFSSRSLHAPDINEPSAGDDTADLSPQDRDHVGSPEPLSDGGSSRRAAPAPAPARPRNLSMSAKRRTLRRPSIITTAIIGDARDHHVHHESVVDHLDAIDPHVSTVTDLTNAANSILIPQLGFFDRRPTVDLLSLTSTMGRSTAALSGRSAPNDLEAALVDDEHDIDKHVADVLSNKSKLRRQLLGLRDFLKTPIGVLAAIYGFLVVFWGAAIVLFLLKWINLHDANKQGLWVEISSQVVNGLFTITGVGLIPWRVRDTFWIGRILHYKRVVRRRRAKRGLEPLPDDNDIPDPLIDGTVDDVLTAKEREDLRKRQDQFSKSQTWYHAHPTSTHNAFHIRTALAICLFNDMNSVGQCILCGCMWGLNRFNRPAWTTGTLIPVTFLCGIGAAVLIWHGGKRTRKTKEVERKLRMALEQSGEPVDDDEPASPASSKSGREDRIEKMPLRAPDSPRSRPQSPGPRPRKSEEQ